MKLKRLICSILLGCAASTFATPPTIAFISTDDIGVGDVSCLNSEAKLKTPNNALELASPFGEGMVLQRQMPVPVWGWGNPGDKITVSFAHVSVSAMADAAGRWHCDLPPLEANATPQEFKVTDGANSILYTNVLVGEVWICCGQSNMQKGYNDIPDIRQLVDETIATKRPVRTLNVQTMIALQEADRCFNASWSTKPPPSAVAASFACLLQSKLNIPVGVVLTSWGSSSIEGWMPLDMEEQLPHFKKVMEKELNADQLKLCQNIIKETEKTGEISYSDDPETQALAKQVKAISANIFCRTRPNLLYNAMLHPLIPMACRGMVYYQGEANGKSYKDMVQYETTQPLWLKRLRAEWGCDDFYFLNVMLPGFGRTLKSGPSRGDLEAVDAHSWAIIREAQMEVLKLPHTAVANTIDLGDEKNIHPKDKMPVGERLALLARREFYGEKNLLAAGPMFQSLERSGQNVVIHFKDADGLKTTDSQPPRAFWLGGEGIKWQRAEASIQGNSVVLTIPLGMKPSEVRYAYAAMPDVNLVNREGLPTYPFRAKLSD